MAGSPCEGSSGEETAETYELGARDELEAVIETAVARGKTWGALTGAERAVDLHVAGLRLEARSAEVLEAMASECGKTLYQRAPHALGLQPGAEDPPGTGD